jgi:membrane-associated phospholipid phosphatase
VIDTFVPRVSESLAVIYFAYLSAAALVCRLPASRRIRVWLASAVLFACDAMVVLAPQTATTAELRDWLPAPVILLAYYATGAFFVEPSARAESWLRHLDDRWIKRESLERIPRAATVYLDLVYNGCFVLIPAGFAVLAWTGRAAQSDRYWTLVSAAEFASFSTLPWFQARPPWAVEGSRPIDRTAMRRFSLSWVNHTSIRATTFPSGHVSASLAAAFALIGSMPVVGVVFLVLAVSISVACVTGRYHYVVDVVAGAALAIVLWLAVAFLSTFDR